MTNETQTRRRLFFGFDFVVFGNALLLSILVLAFGSRIEHAWLYLTYHALACVLVWLIATAEYRFGGRFWRLLRYWYPLILVPAAFREIHFLAPQIHPYAPGYYYDHAFQGLDVQLFSWALHFLNHIAHPLLTDVLSICYWSYFPIPIVLGIVLYKQGKLAEMRHVLCGLLLAWFFSYLCYIIFPAVGPYRVFEPHRPEALKGLFIGESFHRALLNIEWEIPDAFPSGHALIVVMALYYAVRFIRPLFWILLPFGGGLVIATVYLHYHYAVDVIAAFLLVPILLVVARNILTARENP